jgi:glycosyltransferase involved in cell wall biosynthesis
LKTEAPIYNGPLHSEAQKTKKQEVNDLNLSVVIIALNEESNLPRCLASLPPKCEIIIQDSGSSDRTVEIAKSYGAFVFQRNFDNYADHKNAAISHATKDWIFSIDADEEVTPELLTDILNISQSPASQGTVYQVKRQLIFMGRPMQYGRTIDFPARIFPRGAAKFVGAIHEKLVGDLPTKTLAGTLRHYSYKNLSDYFVRFNNYTSKIAQNHAHKGRRASLVQIILRPWFEFVTRYFIKLGFLDGYPGYVYALLSSFYAFAKYAKLKEIESKNNESRS